MIPYDVSCQVYPNLGLDELVMLIHSLLKQHADKKTILFEIEKYTIKQQSRKTSRCAYKNIFTYTLMFINSNLTLKPVDISTIFKNMGVGKYQ